MANEDVRRQLLERREALLRQAARLEHDRHELDANVEIERAEEAQEESLTLVLDRLDERGKAEVEAIDRALARVAQGSFGNCIDCGGAIAPKRLEALPTTERCVDCAQKIEGSAA